MMLIEFGGTIQLKKKKQKKGYCLITLRYRDFIITARGKHMAYTLPADNQVNVQVSYTDKHGNPAQVDGEVTWDSSNPDTVDVVVDTNDSTIATVRAQGAVGNVQVTATADADLGEGTREIVTTMDVTVVAGEAVAGTIAPVGPSEPIP